MGLVMLGKQIQRGFDAGTWNGQVDVKRTAVLFSMGTGLALLWLCLAVIVGFPI